MLPKPAASHPAVAKRMSRQRVADTGVELRVRRALFAEGFRYRKQVAVPGFPRRSIDIAFPRKRLAVFLDGCFWHGCSEHKSTPRSNDRWWASKIEENRRRDLETTAALTACGWTVLRFWEHDAPEKVVTAVRAVLSPDEGRGGNG
ncbi:very short patch repair endonuclease [Rhizobium bangladeshense]